MKSKEVSITISLSQDIVDQLPQDAAERREFLINAIEDRLALRSYASSFARLGGKVGGKVTSEKKAAASRENGKKGGNINKDGSPRKVKPTA
jgi:hypothetical protein